MSRFHITTIRHASNRFALCFVEMAKLLQSGLQDLGHEVTRRDNLFLEDAVNIVFGLHEWWNVDQDPIEQIRKYRTVVYQAEQLLPGGRSMPEWYFSCLEVADAIWDYDSSNVALLQTNGLHSQHVPPAYHPSMEIIGYDDRPKTVDVLFYGAMNARRDYMLKLLGTLCTVQGVVDMWGEERDQFINTTSLMLNIHFYQCQQLETLRLSHLVANRVPVVSESSEHNPYGIPMAEYVQLPALVLKLLRDRPALLDMTSASYELFRKTTITSVLGEALDCLPASLLDNDGVVASLAPPDELPASS